MNVLVDAASWACLAGGGLFCVIGALGLVRMPDFYTRVHAASITDTLGAGLVLAGLLLHSGFNLISVKLLIIALLIFFTSPTATHALARAAFGRGIRPQPDTPDGGEWKA